MSTAFVESAARAAVLPAALPRDDLLLHVRRHSDRPRQLARGVRMNAAAAAAADYSSSADDLTTMRGAAIPRSSSMVFGRDQNSHHLANLPVPGARSRAASRDAPRRVIRVSRKQDPSPIRAAQSDSEAPDAPRAPRRIRVTRLKATTTDTMSSPAAQETASNTSTAPATPAPTPAARPVLKTNVAPDVGSPVVSTLDKKAPADKSSVVPGTTPAKKAPFAPSPVSSAPPPSANGEKSSKAVPAKASAGIPKSTNGDGKKPETEKRTPLLKRLNIPQAIEFSFVATGACITSYATMVLLSGVGSLF